MIAITSFGTADDCKKSVAGVTKIILKWVPLDASQNLRRGLRPRIMKGREPKIFSCLGCQLLRSQSHLPSLAFLFFGSAFIFGVRDETAKVPQLSFDLSHVDA